MKLSAYFKWPLITLLMFVAMGYLIARLLKGFISPAALDVISLAGTFWIVAFIYFLLFWLAFETGLLLLKLTGKIESAKSKLPRAFPQKAVAVIVLFVAMMITAGYMNNRQVVVRKFSINIDKFVEGPQNLRVLVAADLHLGKVVDGPRAEEFVKIINAEKPDIVLLPGDIIDIDPSVVASNGGAEALGKIKAPLGVYASLGNHELYAGEEASFVLLEGHGVNVLKDETIQLPNGLQIAGRLDVARKRFGLTRKPLGDIVSLTDKNKPLILLDHQPKALKEAQDAGVDLIVCGHTHNGQFWPINYVVKMIFDIAYGYARWGQTHIYVTSGLGTWGPPVRIGLPPEIVVIDIHFRTDHRDR